MKNRPAVRVLVIGSVLAACAGGYYASRWSSMKADALTLRLPTPDAPYVPRVKDAVTDEDFLVLVRVNTKNALSALDHITAHWVPGTLTRLIEVQRFVPNPAIVRAIDGVVHERTGHLPDREMFAWFKWLWDQPPEADPSYAAFKAKFYSLRDRSFAEYFLDAQTATIRLDEILWGGVKRDGIPPLSNPRVVKASDASYLEDNNVVFAVFINGEARAYPKRILAWHEMVKDRVGGKDICGVYCTLCGSMIVYDPVAEGVKHELGTSGFLYRSNKLMFDHATKSLWSTLEGTPVVGPLVGKGIELETLPVVTTTWGAWRARHPQTTVLSLDTGHRRDYSEGQAYRDYFATDDLMFQVPRLDARLMNKDEIFIVRTGRASDEANGAETPAPPTVFAASFLSANPVHHAGEGDGAFVVLTDSSGANRAYAGGGVRFVRLEGGSAIDEQGGAWAITEGALTGPGGSTLQRLPGHRSFWFGWQAQFPGTALVKNADEEPANTADQ